MKKKMVAVLMTAAVMMTGTAYGQQKKAEQKSTEAQTEAQNTEEKSTEAQTEAQSTEGKSTEAQSTESTAEVLEDGVYTAEFDTDSGMFHANEACDGKGTLTVENGVMTFHVSLSSKNIVNLFPGLAADAQKEGAEILQPTVDNVTYSDGFSEEVYGFDIPVSVLDEEFDLALLGKKGKWYDHKVSVSNPVKEEPEA